MTHTQLREIAERPGGIGSDVKSLQAGARGIWGGTQAPFSRTASNQDLKLLADQVDTLAQLIESLARHLAEHG